MEGTRRLAGVVAEAVARLEELVLVLAQATLWGEGDLLTVERQMKQVLRQVGSVMVSGLLQQRAQGPDGEATVCPACGGRLHLALRERPRAVLGLVGESGYPRERVAARPTFHGVAGHAGHAPLDEVLGLGNERLSPALAQVVCEQARKDSFAGASKSVQGSLGTYVAEETVRRVAEDVGQLIEHDQADRSQWAVPQADMTGATLLVMAVWERWLLRLWPSLPASSPRAGSHPRRRNSVPPSRLRGNRSVCGCGPSLGVGHGNGTLALAIRGIPTSSVADKPSMVRPTL
jgi:hypothetical protein